MRLGWSGPKTFNPTFGRGQSEKPQAPLPLVLTQATGAVRHLGRAGHCVQHNLADAHAWVQFNGAATQVGKLEGDLSFEAWVDETCGGVHDNGQASDAASPFDPSHQIWWYFDAFHGRSESKLTRLQDKSVAIWNLDPFGITFNRFRVVGVDTRHMR